MKEIIGFGIAGNFALHLEQAGEADDFALVKTDDEYAPKGIFPCYFHILKDILMLSLVPSVHLNLYL